MAKRILVTGGAGFIGSAVVREAIRQSDDSVLVVDKLTYAGNLDSLAPVSNDPRYSFARADIADAPKMRELFEAYQPDVVMHLAAESHVDRSIDGPGEFIQTNVVGSFGLLEEVRAHWSALPAGERDAFRFLHVSTDEVYGSLGEHDAAFSETTPYAPNSPYSASKAASDHLVRAYHHTYGLPTLTTNCSNNYGPYHFPEKLIPLMILNALDGKPLPVYGKGLNVRDWLYVHDHCEAIWTVVTKGKVGDTYNIGGNNEVRNIDVVNNLCSILAEETGRPLADFESLITYVKDRPGHDLRYAIDASKITRELGWSPAETFATGLRKTVRWYLDNTEWVAQVKTGEYRNWIEKNYEQR